MLACGTVKLFGLDEKLDLETAKDGSLEQFIKNVEKLME